MPYTACVAGGSAGAVPGERDEHRAHADHEDQYEERYAEQEAAADLVRRAARGDQPAWEQLVDQYARLVFAVTRSFRLSDSDASDVSQTAWLRLLEHIDRIDPARVGAWLVVTTRRECLRIIALRKRVVLSYTDDAFEGLAGIQPDLDEALLADERALDVRRALEMLPERWQQLVGMLVADPPLPYAVISETLGLPVGSIGPMRGRCLDKLRVLLDA
jgi:RNA polymerase sigma factor (sigma-70 family)